MVGLSGGRDLLFGEVSDTFGQMKQRLALCGQIALKREDVLKKKKEFRYTYRVGASFPGRLFVVVVAPRRRGETRIGISVSKKQGNSVERNRIKRRLREVLTPLVPQLKKGKNIIVVARRTVLEEPFGSLGRSAQRALLKAGALREELGE